MIQFYKYFMRESGLPNYRAYGVWFITSFNVSQFEGLERLLYCCLAEAVSIDVPLTKSFFETWLKTSAKVKIRSEDIRVESTMSYDYKQASQYSEAYIAIVVAAQNLIQSIMDAELPQRDFGELMYEYLKTRASEAYTEALANAFPRFTNGEPPSDVALELEAKLASINEMYDVQKLEDLDFYVSGKDESECVRVICNTGIPALDEDSGGIKTTKLYTLNGQPASGKTKFSMACFVYKVLTEAKEDVLYYELELPKVAIKNMLIAIHITNIFRGTVKIPDSAMEILDNLTPEQRQCYEVAKSDLFDSGKYGKIEIKTECVTERFYNEVRNFAIQHPRFSLLAIDYMGLIESDPPNDGKYHPAPAEYELITQGYKTVKKLQLKYNFAAVCLNQYNDKGIEAVSAGKPIRSGFVQGGHIVNRHTDYDINLTFTEEQKMRKARTLSLGKTRFSEGFAKVLLSTDLAISRFKQGEVSRE